MRDAVLGNASATTPIAAPAHATRTSAAQTAKPAFQAAVDYLDRRAQKGKLTRIGSPQSPLFEALSATNARKPGKVRSAVVAPNTTAATLSTSAVVYGSKGVASLAKAAKGLTAGTPIPAIGAGLDLGASTLGIGANGVGLVSNSLKYHNLRLKKKDAIRDMVRNLEKARQHLEMPERSDAEAAAAYRRFMTAAKTVVHKNREGWLDDASDSNLAQHQSTALVGRYAINTGRNILTVAGAAANTVAASPAGSFLGVGVGAAEAVGAAVTLEAGRRKTRTMRGKQAVIESWRYRQRNNVLQLPVAGIANACRSEMRRQERLANWVKLGARIQIAKAAGNIGLGIAGGVLTTLGLVTAVGAGVLTAGIAVAVIGAAVSTAYLAYAAVRTMRNARADRHGKRRQKEAQALVATHSRSELRSMMAHASPEKRTATAVTIERGGWREPGKRSHRVVSVDVGNNAYVGLHLMAHELVDMLRAAPPGNGTQSATVLEFLSRPEDSGHTNRFMSPEAGAVLRLLQASGMSPFDIQSLCDAAGGLAGDAQLCLLKQAIAGALGIPFRVNAAGGERPLAPFALLGRVHDLLADPQLAARASSTSQTDRHAAAASLFAGVDYYRFAAMVADPAVPLGEKGSAGWFARQLLSDEKQRRSLLIREHFSVGADTLNLLETIPGFDRGSVREMAQFMRMHPHYLRESPEAALRHAQGAQATPWMRQWKAAQAAGALPDMPWVELVCEIDRQSPNRP